MTVINASLLALLLCLPATLLASDGGGINAEIKREMASSRVEVRAELDRARAELEQQNLSLRDSLAVGRRGQSSPSSRDLADAQITPDGVLLIAGTAVATSTAQQQRLRDYRRQVLDMAQIGIDGGEKAAMAALEATDVSLFRMIVGGVSGSLQRRAEKAALQQIAPMVAQICQRLPAVLSLQQSLASDLPAFQPYATLEQRDIDHCQRELGHSIALR